MISRCSGLSFQPLVDELGGQPVEQLRMRRRRALIAEVARRADDAAAEVVLPEAVDHHAGRQRVLGRGDPTRKRAAAMGTAVCGQLLGSQIARGDDTGKARLDLSPLAWALPRIRTNVSAARSPLSTAASASVQRRRYCSRRAAFFFAKGHVFALLRPSRAPCLASRLIIRCRTRASLASSSSGLEPRSSSMPVLDSAILSRSCSSSSPYLLASICVLAGVLQRWSMSRWALPCSSICRKKASIR